MFETIRYYLTGKHPRGTLNNHLKTRFEKPLYVGPCQAMATHYSFDNSADFSTVNGLKAEIWKGESEYYAEDACSVFKDFVEKYNKQSGSKVLEYENYPSEYNNDCRIFKSNGL